MTGVYMFILSEVCIINGGRHCVEDKRCVRACACVCVSVGDCRCKYHPHRITVTAEFHHFSLLLSNGVHVSTVSAMANTPKSQTSLLKECDDYNIKITSLI